MTRVLVIDDDPALLDNVLELLAAEGFDGVGARDGKAGVASALAHPPALIVCDVGMPVMDGHQVVQAIRDYPETSTVPFIFLSARAARADVRKGMNLGADDYITKPFSRVELLEAIRSRIKRHGQGRAPVVATDPDSAASDSAASGNGPVVRSLALRAVFDQAVRVARSDLSVLVLGETGVGKDVLAHAIHKASPRAGQPFFPLNCAALSDSLLESELFGHEKGAFTGAVARRAGLFESARGGTVFLDEIGDLPMATQVKLLRVLEDRRVMRVGGRTYLDIDVRFISATNKDLEAEAEAGRFRTDLYYRIGGVELTVPPLRERLADIAPLAARFALAMNQRMGLRVPVGLTAATLRTLEGWHWPGNVRELRNVVERCVAMSGGGDVEPSMLPDKIRGGAGSVPSGDLAQAVKRQQRELERARIVEALELHAGNQTRAAKALGISRRTLINRLDEFGVARPRK
jgi:two-component system, NtrC family, response regulator AtoC